MRISNINSFYTPQNFCAVKNNTPKGTALTHPNPVKSGLATAAGWFGFGIGLDYLSRKVKFSTSPTKNSFAINAILALGAGTYTSVNTLVKKSDK